MKGILNVFVESNCPLAIDTEAPRRVHGPVVHLNGPCKYYVCEKVPGMGLGVSSGLVFNGRE